MTDTTVNAPAIAAELTITKKASKVSLANAIFQAKMAERKQGLFTSNKEFRAAVRNSMKLELGVSDSSASTMYNQAKLAAEKASDDVGLGRDPKKIKVKVEGAKRGRPAGSTNKKKAAELIMPEESAEDSSAVNAESEAVAA